MEFTPERDVKFERERSQRAGIVEDFLAKMEALGNPGLQRTGGSTMRQITGQEPQHHWMTVVAEREFTVFQDGRHGWSEEFIYSDRPRDAEDEPSPEQVRQAVQQILRENTNLQVGRR